MPRRTDPPPVRIRLPSEKRSLSRSASRALDVLECLGRERRALRAVEIARALGMNASTTNQLLKSMVDSGHLIFAARGKTYLPSSRLAGFAGWMDELHPTGARLHALIGRLQRETGLMVTLATANDVYMQVLDLALPPGQETERGLRISLFGSALGSAWLSMMPDEEVRRLADRARIAAEHLPAMLARLARVREQGFAEGDSGGQTHSLALPLPQAGGPAPLVLGLAGPDAAMCAGRAALLAHVRAELAGLGPHAFNGYSDRQA